MFLKNIIVIFIAFIISRTSAEGPDHNITELLVNLNLSDDFGNTRIEVSLPHQFRYVPVTKQGCFNFWVKTDNEAQISLSNSAQYNDPKVKIIIGGWENTASAVIIDGDEVNIPLKVYTPGIINKNKNDGFWVRWSTNGDILVGKISERMPFMVYKYTKKWFPINFVGVANRDRDSGNGLWTIKDKHNCDF